MRRIVLRLDGRVKGKLKELWRGTTDKGQATRCRIVMLSSEGRTAGDVAEVVGCSVSWVNRVRGRFREHGLAGLLDRREDNGEAKLDERYLSLLHETVDRKPDDFGFPRPTWTREMLVLAMARQTGVHIHVATMSRALAEIGARRGRPRPVVGCPWGKRRKTRRLREILRAVKGAGGAGADEAAVYLDEMDIHLNPKIGLDWMNRGTQKEVMTPGKNAKRYVVGALDDRTGRLTWVMADKKNSLLFIKGLERLLRVYADRRVIHVVLDNYAIHSSRQTQAWLAEHGRRLRLHFLPPYCPEANRIERLWQDLHANVTRNHRCVDMPELEREVMSYLMQRNRRAAKGRLAA